MKTRKNKSFKIIFIILLISLVSCKLRVADDGECIFFNTSERKYAVLPTKFLNKQFGEDFGNHKLHLFIKFTGYENWSYQKEWKSINMVSGRFISLGLSSDVVFSSPKFFLIDEDEGHKSQIEIEGAHILLFSPECHTLLYMFIDFKNQKVNVKQKYNVTQLELEQRNTLFLE